MNLWVILSHYVVKSSVHGLPSVLLVLGASAWSRTLGGTCPHHYSYFICLIDLLLLRSRDMIPASVVSLFRPRTTCLAWIVRV